MCVQSAGVWRCGGVGICLSARGGKGARGAVRTTVGLLGVGSEWPVPVAGYRAVRLARAMGRRGPVRGRAGPMCRLGVSRKPWVEGGARGTAMPRHSRVDAFRFVARIRIADAGKLLRWLGHVPACGPLDGWCVWPAASRPRLRVHQRAPVACLAVPVTAGRVGSAVAVVRWVPAGDRESVKGKVVGQSRTTL